MGDLNIINITGPTQWDVELHNSQWRPIARRRDWQPQLDTDCGEVESDSTSD